MLGSLRAAEYPAAQAVFQPNEIGNSEAGLKRQCFQRSLARSGGQPRSGAPQTHVVQQHGFLNQPTGCRASPAWLLCYLLAVSPGKAFNLPAIYFFDLKVGG